ncbi:hypothetical protein GCM10010909_18320 [Acidocella aquatica]|uniref:Metal-dependent hydrolase n=1 Tax=Acidocella aquatica TaxID=1922313 RepID=A0ABQ6A5M7_9PROT|nr:metal-dependent hydrolase [Acidocella aquatica]GLR67151.1 hypothetical protein GCM10010909_18320 [Acidocella aquatica]
MLTPRRPGIAFERGVTPILWSRDHEFAQFLNGVSVIIAPIEHLLNNVANEVRTKHCENNPALKEELELFIKQETNHTLYHNRFNKLLLDAGYDIKPVIAKVTAELKEMRDKKSLAFCAAYCAGFENTATFTAKYVYEQCDKYFEGAEPSGANLWLWHISEEFEHRTSCHEAFNAVSGSYFLRIWGFLYSFWHVNHCFWRGTAVLLRKDRETMTASQRWASRFNQARNIARQFSWAIPRMLQLLSPAFDPAKMPIPPRIQAALDFFKTTDPINETFISVYRFAPE